MLLDASLEYCIAPWKYFDNNLSSADALNTGYALSFIHFVKFVVFLQVDFPVALSLLYSHQVSSPGEQKRCRNSVSVLSV